MKKILLLLTLACVFACSPDDKPTQVIKPPIDNQIDDKVYQSSEDLSNDKQWDGYVMLAKSPSLTNYDSALRFKNTATGVELCKFKAGDINYFDYDHMRTIDISNGLGRTWYQGKEYTNPDLLTSHSYSTHHTWYYKNGVKLDNQPETWTFKWKGDYISENTTKTYTYEYSITKINGKYYGDVNGINVEFIQQ